MYIDIDVHSVCNTILIFFILPSIFFYPRTSKTIAFSPVPNIIMLKDLRMGRCEEELLEVGDEVSASLLTNYKPL